MPAKVNKKDGMTLSWNKYGGIDQARLPQQDPLVEIFDK